MAQYAQHNDQQFAVGDTVRVHQKIVEGDKTRVQIFEGTVIAIRNRGAGTSFVVRKLASDSVGVERIIPLQSPNLQQVEVKVRGDVRRSKLYYLRDRLSRASMRVKKLVEARPTTA